MNARAARLARLTALVVLGRFEELAQLRRNAPAGEPDRAWREAVLQTHLFAGFPRLVEAYEALDAAGGLGVPDGDEGEDALAPGSLAARGAALFDRIYGAGADEVRARMASFHPDYHRWIAEHAYGRVLSRPGLDAATREICAVAALAALGQERQLASHARGAVRCGAGSADVAAVLDVLADVVPPARLARARGVLARFAR